jgi:uncharacterized protein YciI
MWYAIITYTPTARQTLAARPAHLALATLQDEGRLLLAGLSMWMQLTQVQRASPAA